MRRPPRACWRSWAAEASRVHRQTPRPASSGRAPRRRPHPELLANGETSTSAATSAPSPAPAPPIWARVGARDFDPPPARPRPRQPPPPAPTIDARRRRARRLLRPRIVLDQPSQLGQGPIQAPLGLPLVAGPIRVAGPAVTSHSGRAPEPPGRPRDLVDEHSLQDAHRLHLAAILLARASTPARWPWSIPASPRWSIDPPPEFVARRRCLATARHGVGAGCRGLLSRRGARVSWISGRVGDFPGRPPGLRIGRGRPGRHPGEGRPTIRPRFRFSQQPSGAIFDRVRAIFNRAFCRPFRRVVRAERGPPSSSGRGGPRSARTTLRRPAHRIENRARA